MPHFSAITPFVHWRAWLYGAVSLAVALLIAEIALRVLFGLAARIARRRGGDPAHTALRHIRRPLQWLLPILAVSAVLPGLPASNQARILPAHVLGFALIGVLGWLMVAALYVAEDLLNHRFRIETQDNLRARRVQTQLHLVRQILGVIIGLITLGIALMTVPAVRQIGDGLFASAGLVGLIAGMAARPTLASLIAGIQIAFTEPMRIEDVVIVEGEWGWIEEIHTTYVVVRIWDLRRLIVPLSYFIEKPFQNWTRNTANLLGHLYIYADYTLPVEELRQQVHAILKTTPLWDGKVWNLQVTDAREQTMQLRVLVSAADSGKAWDLRCYVREQLIAYLQKNYPQALPRTRVELPGKVEGEGISVA